MVKQGYKQTEIGVIPEEWSVVVFSKCFKTLSNNTLSRAELNDEEGLVKNVHYGDILVKYGNVLNCATERLPYINDVNKKSNLMFLTNGDLIIADTAEDETVGKAVEIAKVGEQKVVSGLHTIPCRPISHDMFAKGWLGYYINHSIYHDQLLPFITGTKVSAVSKSAIAGTLILVPPLEEQERIAEALSDVDNLIISLEKLIAKKKAIKQGTMQELLTGKKRLPGFTGEWSTINLSNKSKIKARIGWQGLTTNEYLDSGFAYLVTGTDFDNGKIAWDGCHYVAKDRFDQDKNIQIQNDDILITKDGSLGKTALVKSLNKPATLNSGVFLIRPIQGAYDPAYVYYILSSFVFKNFLDHLSAGSTIIHLYQKDISKFEFAIPVDINEQTAIASMLSDMDSEIEVLEEKLEKTRQVKQGMMQELLTGRIRLV